MPPRQYTAWWCLVQVCILLASQSVVTAEYTDFSMAPWEPIQKPWIGDENVEMAALALRKFKKVLLNGGVVYVRGSLAGVTRYASVAQGPEDHEKTSADGCVLSVGIDLATIIEGGLRLGPLASRIEDMQKLFASRPGMRHEDLPTVFAFQFPTSSSLRPMSSSDSLPSDIIDSAVSPAPSQTTLHPLLKLRGAVWAPVYWMRGNFLGGVLFTMRAILRRLSCWAKLGLAHGLSHTCRFRSAF